MIDMLKRMGEWIGDYICEILLFGTFIITIVLIVSCAVVVSDDSNDTSSNASSQCNTTIIPIYNGRSTTLIPITRCY